MRKIVFGVSAGAAGLWLLWLMQRPIINYYNLDWPYEKLGQWGDTFGALSALFSAAAFIGAVYAIRQQQVEIEQARLEQQTINLEARNERHRQQFESSFYQLLRLLRETRDEVRYRYSPAYIRDTMTMKNEAVTGLATFRMAWIEAKHFMEQEGEHITSDRAGEIYYEIVHKRYESTLGPYYRVVYTILRRIQNDDILNEPERQQYGNLIRTQLTSYELALIGLNGLSTVSNDMDIYITNFHLLKYLPDNTARRRILTRYYPDEAFQGRD